VQWYVRLLGALATGLTYAAWQRHLLAAAHNILSCGLRCRACVVWCARCRPATPVGAPFERRGCRQWWLVAHQGPAILPGAAPSGHAEAPSDWLVDAEGSLLTRGKPPLRPSTPRARERVRVRTILERPLPGLPFQASQPPHPPPYQAHMLVRGHCPRPHAVHPCAHSPRASTTPARAHAVTRTKLRHEVCYRIAYPPTNVPCTPTP
jgi:hypothetical protein